MYDKFRPKILLYFKIINEKAFIKTSVCSICKIKFCQDKKIVNRIFSLIRNNKHQNLAIFETLATTFKKLEGERNS
jgi:hypothetical protein